MGKTGLGGINARFHIIVIIPQLFQDVKDTGYRAGLPRQWNNLPHSPPGSHVSGSIPNPHYRNQWQFTNCQLQMGCAFQSTGIHRRLIYHNIHRTRSAASSSLVVIWKVTFPYFRRGSTETSSPTLLLSKTTIFNTGWRTPFLLSLKRSAKSALLFCRQISVMHFTDPDRPMHCSSPMII